MAIDLCTGCGRDRHGAAAAPPGARASSRADVDERAVANARANGVEAYAGDLFAPLPADSRPRDVVVARRALRPDAALALLQRDTFTFETPLAYDGGADGTDMLRRVLAEAPRASSRRRRAPARARRRAGRTRSPTISARLGYADVAVLRDEDGDVRGIEATLVRDAGSSGM